jgi:UDP-N-acetylmuramoyl-tripeptide--D-alanyl-D-alanine ligase
MYDYLNDNGGKAFVNADDAVLVEMAAERAGLETIPYGVGFDGAEILPSSAEFPFLRMAIPTVEGKIEIDTHLIGAYNANNVMAAISIGRHFGVSLESAVAAVDSYVPANNRSQMRKTDKNIVISDAYNANPTSMAAALDSFRQVESPRKVVLLGDMRELGRDSVPEHIKVLREAESLGLDSIYLVGEEFRKALVNVGRRSNVHWFPTSEELASHLVEKPLSGCTVLVKGSRGTEMEKVMPGL